MTNPRAPVPAAAAAAVLLLATGPVAAGADEGERLFQRCYSCHSLDPAERDLSGPNLRGVVGRRAASLPDYEYSDAMRAAAAGGLVWTPETLDRYLTDPEEFMPEGRMAGVRLRDPVQRRILIEWLALQAR